MCVCRGRGGGLAERAGEGVEGMEGGREGGQWKKEKKVEGTSN